MQVFSSRPAAGYHRPAVPVVLALIAGIILGDRLPGHAVLAMACLAPALTRLVICLWHRQPARLAPLVAVVTAGYLAIAPWRAPVYGPDHLTGYLDGGYWRVSATVVQPSRIRLGRTRTVASVNTLTRGADSRTVTGRIRLTIMAEATLTPGDRIHFAARLRPFRNFKNPGSFDFAGTMASRGIHASAWVRPERLHRDGLDRRWMAARRLHALRQHLGELIDRSGSPAHAEARRVLKALVFGDRSGIDPDLRERFNRAGVGHLLAVSGLHVGIVAAVAFAVFRWLLSRVPALLWRGWVRPWAAGATLVPVVIYALLAGLSPSTQRAAVMVAVFLVAMIAGRTHEILNTLAVAALVLLAVFPPALFSVAFQLSFAAVLAIVYGMQEIAVRRDPADTLPGRLTRRLAGFVLVSILAIGGTLPVVLYHFNQTSLVGLPANLIVIPLAGFVTVPLGLASALSAVFSNTIAMAGFTLALHILHTALAVVNGVAGFSLAAVQTVTPSLFEIGLYYLAGWALFNLRRRPRIAWVLAAVAVLAAGDGLYWVQQRFWHRDLRVAAIDVGQGSSALLELPGGTVVLMDGGGFADNRFFDVGRRIVAPFLWRRKIGRVDILVLSHPNADHLNGLIYIARHFGVRELWTNGDTNTTIGYRELMAACRTAGVVVRRMEAGSPPAMFGDASLTVLHPPPGLFDPSADDIDQETRNGGSLVLRASLGDTAFLFTGDITAPAERQLVERERGRLAATVLFAPHHGSRTSSSMALIDAVQPAVVVISAGAANRFGFPHAEVTARYREAGAGILCTAAHGAVLMQADGQRVRYRTVADPDGSIVRFTPAIQ